MNKILPVLLVIAACVIALRSLDRPASNVFNGNVVIRLDIQPGAKAPLYAGMKWQGTAGDHG